MWKEFRAVELLLCGGSGFWGGGGRGEAGAGADGTLAATIAAARDLDTAKTGVRGGLG